MMGRDKRRIVGLTLPLMLIGAAAVFLQAAGGADSPSADDIVKKYISALGGEENLRAVQSKVMKYKVFMQTMPGYLVTQRIDRKGTLKSQRHGSERYLFFDGEKLWNIHKNQKKELQGKVVDQFRRKADLNGPFLDYRKMGIQLNYLGKTRVEFSEFHKLEATWADGTKIIYCFDQSDGLLKMTKEPSYRMQNGKITEGPRTITYYYDYREVNGILLPFLWIQTDDQLEHMHLFLIENIEINK